MFDKKNRKHVKKLQKLMIEFGYDLGHWGADGSWGKKTQSAVEQLLKDSETKSLIEWCKEYGFTKEQAAYVMATVKHETNGTMEPVREAYWLSESWRKKNLRYYGTGGWYGRGYVQITWKKNYEKFSEIIGIDLVNNPDLALNPDVAAKILCYGFKHGTFTGKKISDYINSDKVDYVNARRCINGTDKADLIAKYARKYAISRDFNNY